MRHRRCTWTVTAVCLQGGERAEWCDLLATLLLAKDNGIKPAFVEMLVRDWLENPEHAQ